VNPLALRNRATSSAADGSIIKDLRKVLELLSTGASTIVGGERRGGGRIRDGVEPGELIDRATAPKKLRQKSSYVVLIPHKPFELTVIEAGHPTG
jgi:hypothetical protein